MKADSFKETCHLADCRKTVSLPFPGKFNLEIHHKIIGFGPGCELGKVVPHTDLQLLQFFHCLLMLCNNVNDCMLMSLSIHNDM